MGFIGGQLGYLILRTIAPPSRYLTNSLNDQSTYQSKVTKYFGKDFFELVKGKIVIDFGCGYGKEAIEIAKNGAKKVIGIDIREKIIAQAQSLADKEGVSDKCYFDTTSHVLERNELADILISIDAFEHFENPSLILSIMGRLIKKDGFILTAFGPTWLHPYGGHLFSVFPWAHLLFTEKALIRWRSDFKKDKATCFAEVEGGLNQLTINKFETFISESPFKIDFLETVPIKGIKVFRSKYLREFFSSIVRCKLILR